MAPEDCIPNYPIRQGSAGAVYTVGSGHEIQNKGEQPTIVQSMEGLIQQLVWQITAASRPILSVSRLTEDGCDVTFLKNKKGGNITFPERQ